MPDLHVMQVPSSGPSLRILIDAGQEEVLKKPYVSRRRQVEPVVVLKSKEEELPFVPKSTCDIIPESFNPSVMDTSVVNR
jgi:hypothetical protein